MADAILSKLQVKNKPKENIPSSIKINKPVIKESVPVTIDTKIIDKRTSTFNRVNFLSKIRKESNIETKLPTPLEFESEQQIQSEKPSFYDSITTHKKITPITTSSSLPKTQSQSQSQSSIILSFNPTKNAKKIKKLKLIANITSIPDVRETLKKLKIPKSTSIPKTGPISLLEFEELSNKLPIEENKYNIIAPQYYLNNRAAFINFISNLFEPYQAEIEKSQDAYNCRDPTSTEFNLLTHQSIVRDYINLYTPYRGLLLYHGLGSGKTCSSIAIAEGLKTDQKIIIMTPASLQVNYREELKKCGDKLYKRNQYWEFINIKGNQQLLQPLADALSLSPEFILKNNGVWFVNVKKKSNYETLSQEDKLSLDKQITKMIENKYQFINYNGLRSTHPLLIMINNGINPFSNKVVIIDEAHNFVSRIINKLKKTDSISVKLYKNLMSAENTRIVLLTGTPIINYPNESAIMLNILRGKIKTWRFQLSINEARKVTVETLLEIFKKKGNVSKLLDFIEYNPSGNILKITRNPFGFISIYDREIYKGVNKKTEDGEVTDTEFIEIITNILLKNNISIIPNSATVEEYTCLPDTFDAFSAEFIDENNKVKNMEKFKKRILGLVSYFPDIEALLPQYEKDKNFHLIKIKMSDFQFNIYEEARVQERKLESKNAQKRKIAGNNIYEESVSTYRIFSRAFCNFVFPRPDINRPFPREDLDVASNLEALVDEDILDAYTPKKKIRRGKYYS